MPRLAANLTYLFTELPMMRRFAAARRAGFEGVEILFPYDLAARELAQGAKAAGLAFVLMNTPPPNWAGGPRGFAAEPGNEARFRSDFDRALRYAEALGTQHLHIMAGKATGAQARRTMVANLAWAAARAPRLSLTIEPINPEDMPGYFLDSFDLAAEILAEVGAPNLGLQFDTHHARVIHGDVLELWQRMAPLVRHVQIAGHPGRHEPDRADTEGQAFLRALDHGGYRGWVAAEYVPRGSTEAGIGWVGNL